MRVIVLDNSEGSLEDRAAEGQQSWLQQQLSDAQEAGLPVVVVTSRPLRNLHTANGEDGEAVASLLASSGVLAGVHHQWRVPGQRLRSPRTRPALPRSRRPRPGRTQIPEYEGASLGYQQTKNNGVMWYFASINTQAREVHVAAVPVIESLSLKAVDGLSVARSLTLQFEAVGRRPAGTLATKANEAKPFEGYDDYVEIPAPSCGECMRPSYTFASSEPTIGNFVEPSGPGSPFPKLSASGHPIASSTSGLFCAYNSGTTTVSITAGLLSYSSR